MPCKFGDIVLIRFPFTNQTGFKQRPAVVVSSSLYHSTRPDVVVMAVTSQVSKSLSAGDTPIVNWSSAGLLKPSSVKPIFFTIEQRLIPKSLGAIDISDQARLRTAISELLG